MRRDLEGPVVAEPADGQPEGGVLRPGVEEQQERVVADRFPMLAVVAERLAVEKQPDRAQFRVTPVALGHATTVEPEPPRARQAPVDRISSEEALLPEHLVLAA